MSRKASPSAVRFANEGRAWFPVVGKQDFFTGDDDIGTITVRPSPHFEYSGTQITELPYIRDTLKAITGSDHFSVHLTSKHTIIKGRSFGAALYAATRECVLGIPAPRVPVTGEYYIPMDVIIPVARIDEKERLAASRGTKLMTAWSDDAPFPR